MVGPWFRCIYGIWRISEMSNLAAFKNLVRRAQVKADNQICLIENMPITTSLLTLL
uniref:Uncharacterized protein n=1 Tax=Escherichia phage vB_EcoM_4HA13 TaxID=2601675 RepID=A0A7D0NEK3_9CAUD